MGWISLQLDDIHECRRLSNRLSTPLDILPSFVTSSATVAFGSNSFLSVVFLLGFSGLCDIGFDNDSNVLGNRRMKDEVGNTLIFMLKAITLAIGGTEPVIVQVMAGCPSLSHQ